MALCHKQCPDCPMMVTVLIDVPEFRGSDGEHIVELQQNVVTEIFQMMIADPLNTEVSDLSIILRVAGVDVASKCSFIENKNDDNDVELF